VEKNAYIEALDKRRKVTNRQWSIGLSVDDKGRIVDTVEDRAAARAGAGPGMKLIAVNGHRYAADDEDATTAVLDAAIVAAQHNHRPIELLIESGDYYRTLSVAYFEGPRYPHLTRIEGRADTLSQVLRPRSN
jgi:predicted metalloprotease with PDZ domain